MRPARIPTIPAPVTLVVEFLRDALVGEALTDAAAREAEGAELEEENEVDDEAASEMESAEEEVDADMEDDEGEAEAEAEAAEAETDAPVSPDAGPAPDAISVTSALLLAAFTYHERPMASA